MHHGFSLSTRDLLMSLNASGVELDVNTFLKGEGVSRKFAWLWTRSPKLYMCIWVVYSCHSDFWEATAFNICICSKKDGDEYTMVAWLNRWKGHAHKISLGPPLTSAGTVPDLSLTQVAIRVWAVSSPTRWGPLKSRANTADKSKRAWKTGADLPCVDPCCTPFKKREWTLLTCF